jgi:hypothetical protein
LFEPGALAAVAEHDDDDPLVAAAAKRRGGVDELVEAVRPANRPGVERDEAAREPVLGAEALVDHVRSEDIQICRVGDQ